MDKYREVSYHLKVSQEYKPLSLVQLNSRKFLVVWVGKSRYYHGCFCYTERMLSNIAVDYKLFPVCS